MIKLPTEEQCLRYFEEYKVPHNIKEHCLKVREVAVFLAKKLQEKGVDVNVELVDRISLLHDIFKVVVIEDLEKNEFYNYTYSDEEVKMWEMLRQKYFGMHECDVAHIIFKDDFPELANSLKFVSKTFKGDKLIEERISHYADWRVCNNSVITLQERLENLKLRYKKEGEVWEKLAEFILVEENKLFSNLDFSPEELKNMEINNGR